jgi:hypothetical protein
LNKSTHVDPISGDPVLVLNTELTLSNETACAVFESCKSTGKAEEFPPLPVFAKNRSI